MNNAIRNSLKECYTYTIQILFFHHALKGRDQKTLIQFDECLKEKKFVFLVMRLQRFHLPILEQRQLQPVKNQD